MQNIFVGVQVTRSKGEATNVDLRDERDLFAASFSGDSRALEHIYQRYHGPLLAHLARRTTDRCLAEDVAQDALLRAFDKLHQLDPDRPLWPWLKKIGEHLLIDAFRRNARIAPSCKKEGTACDVDQSATIPIEERTILASALKGVPVRQRKALALSYLSDFAARDAADFLGISRNAFDQLLHRARESLRQQYLLLDGTGTM